jgi:hypothetical protein
VKASPTQGVGAIIVTSFAQYVVPSKFLAKKAQWYCKLDFEIQYAVQLPFGTGDRPFSQFREPSEY